MLKLGSQQFWAPEHIVNLTVQHGLCKVKMKMPLSVFSVVLLYHYQLKRFPPLIWDWIWIRGYNLQAGLSPAASHLSS